MAENSGGQRQIRIYVPGDQVRWFAHQKGWPIRENNIIVEGNDAAYFTLAAELHKEMYGKDLLADLAVFPTGDGDEGGTFGILRYFPVLKTLIEVDVDAFGRRQFQAIALLDSDSSGRGAKNGLVARHTTLQEHRDVFLLHRRLSRSTTEPVHLGKLIAADNLPWKRIDCEIEDLLSATLIEAFVDATPKACRCPPVYIGDGHHFEFHEGVKPALLRFAKANAILSDVSVIAEALMSLRYYLRLQPEGS